MFSHVLKRMLRNRATSLGVFLFAVIMCATLCILHAANESEIAHFNEVYHTIPVELIVTNLTGTKSEGLKAAPWVKNVFTGDYGVKQSFAEYVKDLKIRAVMDIEKINDEAAYYPLVGITDYRCASELQPENMCEITWTDGYDESIFQSDELVCLIPSNFASEFPETPEMLSMEFVHTEIATDGSNNVKTTRYRCKVTVAGIYSNESQAYIYAPYSVYELACHSTGETIQIDSISATLANNDLLEQFRNEIRPKWFAEPNAVGKETAWDSPLFDSYPYALDINDDMLVKMSQTLQTSITVNHVCSIIIFLVSTAAGFFIGFLIIRKQKRDILLMRTMGTPQFVIFIGYFIEQALCIILGAFIGGALWRWIPCERLGSFIGLYCIGLIVSLLVFMHKNLLTGIKEDE